MSGLAVQRSLGVLILLYLFSIVHGQCRRNESDTSAEPDFLCLVQANITRLQNCSTRVIETIVFPHNSGNPWRRDISFYDGQVVLDSSISVKREGRPTQFQLDKNHRKNEYRLTVKAGQSDVPVQFQLQYTLINGVLNYTGQCNFDGERDDDGNIIPQNLISWNLGKWGKVIDLLTVTFRTTKKNGKLRFGEKQDGTETGLEISYNNTDVKKTLTVHALENETDMCALEWQCERKSTSVFTIVFWVIFSLIIACCCLSAICGGSSRGDRNLRGARG